MNHTFNTKSIPEGQKCVVEICYRCGKESRRYGIYTRTYKWPDGKWSGTSTSCETTKKEEPKP